MTEGLPLTDISLPEIEAAGAGDGVCVGRPLPGVELLIAPLDAAGRPAETLTDRAGETGEIWVRAAHLRDRYDALWVTDQAAAAHPGWHRTGDVGALDEQGRLWVQGRMVHVISTADGPVTPVGIEQSVQRDLGDRTGATGGKPGVAVVGVGPAGTQQVVVVLTGTGGPLAPLALTDTARAAAGRDVAAVLVTKSLPVDIRHNSKVDRVAVGQWAARVLSGRSVSSGDRPVKILVTGASGMTGRALVTALIARGDEVTVLQRRPAGLDAAEVLGDIADPDVVRRAVTGHEAVLHLAAKVDVVGPWADFQRVNVDGTGSVVAACRAAGVARLVHVSSPSVAHAGSALIGAGAGRADPESARSNYSRSKAMAERIALAADGPELAVLCLRPHLIWGPGDVQLVEPVVQRARAGRLPLIGHGTALIDTTVVDNAVDALVAAVDACGPVHGEALVVSNGEPRPVGEILRPGVPGGRGARPARPGAAAGRDDGGCRGGGRLADRPPAGRSAAHPVPGRAAGHRALVRPAADQGGAGLDAAGQPGRGVRGARRSFAERPVR